MPMSERQQLLLLKQQQEAEALAAAETPVEDEEPKHPRRDSGRKQPTKKKELSLDERKQLAREMAKKGAEDEAKEETNEESSEAEFGEEKPASKKRRLTDDDPDRDEEASLNENLNEDADEPTEKSFKRLVRKRTKRQAAFSDDSDSQEGKNGKVNDDEVDEKTESKTEADTARQRKGSIPRRAGGIPKKTEISRDEKPGSLLTNLKPASTSIHPTIASIRTKTMQPLSTTSTKPPRRGDATRGPQIVVSHVPSSTGAAPIAPVHPAWNSGEAPTIERRTPPPPHTHTGEKDPRVLQALHALCESLNKDNRFQIRTGPAVDMSGSFLSDERYDFFDRDDAGDILFPARIPIFPEDFPPGMPEWPLHWWGIIDPVLASAPSTPKESEELIRSQERRHQPPSSHLHPPPPHLRPEGGARGRGWGRGGGWGRGSRGAPPPFHGAPPPFHGGLPPPFPSPVAPRGRGTRPGDRRPPESDWRPSGPPPDRR